MTARDTQIIMQLLDDWELGGREVIDLLGLEGLSLRHSDKYRSGTAPFPESRDLDKKLTHITGIANALETTFPKNKYMARVWLNRPHRRLSKKTPLEKVLHDGMNGLLWVRSELDCSFAWQQSQERRQQQ